MSSKNTKAPEVVAAPEVVEVVEAAKIPVEIVVEAKVDPAIEAAVTPKVAEVVDPQPLVEPTVEIELPVLKARAVYGRMIDPSNGKVYDTQPQEVNIKIKEGSWLDCQIQAKKIEVTHG